jgi:hypothetical protein
LAAGAGFRHNFGGHSRQTVTRLGDAARRRAEN